jgi:hypothetical protein
MAARGERIIETQGREIRVLFTNRALAGAEKRLGRGILGVLRGFDGGSSGVGDVAILLHAGMEAARVDAKSGGRPVSMDDAYEVMDQAGLAAVAGPVLEAVAAVIGYAEGAEAENGADPNG